MNLQEFINIHNDDETSIRIIPTYDALNVDATGNPLEYMTLIVCNYDTDGRDNPLLTYYYDPVNGLVLGKDGQPLSVEDVHNDDKCVAVYR